MYVGNADQDQKHFKRRISPMKDEDDDKLLLVSKRGMYAINVNLHTYADYS